MTVTELIEELKKVNFDAEVKIRNLGDLLLPITGVTLGLKRDKVVVIIK